MTSTNESRSASETSSGLLDGIRSACAEVTHRAGSVSIDGAALEAFARRLAGEDWAPDDFDPAHEFEGDASETLAFVIALDAINFGSGWFPVLKKRPGMSGYRTIAAACRERFEIEGAWRGKDLRAATPEAMAELLEQDLRHAEVAELMDLYAWAWRDLGEWLAAEHDDRFETLIEGAAHSAECLVALLAQMPLYHDVSSYDELAVPFYKRAQITAADLDRVFHSKGFGRFDDLDRLTLFADNLVPHVLRCENVLVYEASLAARIDAEEILVANSSEEVEIRAVAVEAVERIVAALCGLGRATSARELDGLLWNAGQAAAIKARPRHRARCTYY